MRRLLALALLIGSAPLAADELHWKEHGFSIKPLAGHSDTSTQQVVILMLPQSDGFAANVNVQVQPFPGSIDDYLKISLDQFKTMGVQVLLQKRPSKNVLVLEYEGLLQGTPMHWYARAETARGKVYLATGTSSKSGWDAVAARLKETVDSLKLDK